MYLVMINGPSGVGKSVTSKALIAKIKGSVLVHLDDIRDNIPAEKFTTNGKHDSFSHTWHANVLGVEMAKKALENDNTVIVDAIRYHPEWIEPWEKLGKQSGAKVLDIFLIAPKPVVLNRAANRGYDPGGHLTPQKVSDLYDQVVEFYKGRPVATTIDNEHLSIDEVADLIMNEIDRSA